MQRFSIFTLARDALTKHAHAERHWRKAEPKNKYDIVVVGGSGHGLATALELARTYGLRDIAVLEEGAIGGHLASLSGIVRSDHRDADVAALLEDSRRNYQELNKVLNFNVKFSPHGVLRLALDDFELDCLRRGANDGRLTGIDLQLLPPARVRRATRRLGTAGDDAPQVRGASLQRDGGTAHRGAVSWAYARAASDFGIDIVEHCRVTEVAVRQGRVAGVMTDSGPIRADKVAIAAGRNTHGLCATAGIGIPLRVHPVTVIETEPVKPLMRHAIVAGALGTSIFQRDTGEIVIETCPGLATVSGAHSELERAEMAAWSAVSLFPVLGNLRMVRRMPASFETAPDRRPIVSATPVRGLYVNGGWGAHSFAAVPASGSAFADLVATGNAAPGIASFSLDRFPAMSQAETVPA